MDSTRLNEELENLSDDLQIGNDEESIKKLRDLIQCPVCLELPLPPIYLCKRGHIVCTKCQERTYCCPLCRDDYTNARSFVAEGLIENCTLKCRFRTQGCDQTFKGSALVNHMKECQFRPAKCFYCKDGYIPYGGYHEHLLNKHEVVGTQSNKGSIKFNVPFQSLESYPTILIAGLEGINYYIKLVWLTWQGQVNHFREDPFTNIKHGGGLLIPFQVVRSNCLENETAKVLEWSFNVSIREIAFGPQNSEQAKEQSKTVEVDHQQGPSATCPPNPSQCTASDKPASESKDEALSPTPVDCDSTFGHDLGYEECPSPELPEQQDCLFEIFEEAHHHYPVQFFHLPVPEIQEQLEFDDMRWEFYNQFNLF